MVSNGNASAQDTSKCVRSAISDLALDEDAVRRVKLGFRSADGTSQIRALMWEPAKGAGVAPFGIIQIVHGMAEYLKRYDEFACYLVGQGFVVCAADMIGHGLSVSDPEQLGHIPLDAGKDALITDVHELRKTVASRFSRHVPYTMFGHSMGSFIVRSYVTHYGEGLASAVLCGTGQQAVALSKFGNVLSRHLAATKGETYRSAFIDKLGVGAYAKKIPNARTPLDWLSTDEAVVDAYIADELCGSMFTVGGYAALTDLTGEVAAPASAAKVPKDLPLLFVSGSEDPVGENGEAVRRAVESYRQAGVKTVDCIIYEGMRHEILNEIGRAEVYEDISSWISEHKGN